MLISWKYWIKFNFLALANSQLTWSGARYNITLSMRHILHNLQVLEVVGPHEILLDHSNEACPSTSHVNLKYNLFQSIKSFLFGTNYRFSVWQDLISLLSNIPFKLAKPQPCRTSEMRKFIWSNFRAKGWVQRGGSSGALIGSLRKTRSRDHLHYKV